MIPNRYQEINRTTCILRAFALYQGNYSCGDSPPCESKSSPRRVFCTLMSKSVINFSMFLFIFLRDRARSGGRAKGIPRNRTTYMYMASRSPAVATRRGSGHAAGVEFLRRQLLRPLDSQLPKLYSRAVSRISDHQLRCARVTGVDHTRTRTTALPPPE